MHALNHLGQWNRFGPSLISYSFLAACYSPGPVFFTGGGGGYFRFRTMPPFCCLSDTPTISFGGVLAEDQ